MCIELDELCEVGNQDLSCSKSMWFFFEDPESSCLAKVSGVLWAENRAL